MESGGDRTGGDDRVAVIAGGGQLPVQVVETLRHAGRAPFVIAIEGEADPALLQFEHETIYPVHVGRLMSILDRVKPSAVVMIGAVKGRPSILRAIPDWPTLRVAARMLPKLRSGDDTLLRSVVDMIEEAGYPVRGVHEFLPDLLARKGNIAGPKPSKRDLDAVMTAANGAVTLGALDAGQACVAVGRRIVALEGAEGTDLMLERVAELRKLGRLPAGRGGVLVKLAKPNQEIRVDLPTIGISTVEKAAAAGLRGIAVHAGHALIADHESACGAAKQLDVFILGIDPEDSEYAGERP
ncbi:LpxI family protein [Oricola sp.]|uniref:LpxI family protein n=1 Tax=Oricola sp. TaxID=1979950 RepID=UPI003BAD1D0D